MVGRTGYWNSRLQKRRIPVSAMVPIVNDANGSVKPDFISEPGSVPRTHVKLQAVTVDGDQVVGIGRPTCWPAGARASRERRFAGSSHGPYSIAGRWNKTPMRASSPACKWGHPAWHPTISSTPWSTPVPATSTREVAEGITHPWRRRISDKSDVALKSLFRDDVARACSTRGRAS
jgi:hypothetical protein